MDASHAPYFLENQTKSGVVLFIHGFMGSPRQFYKFAHSVHEKGKSAAVLLLPGHGGTSKEFSTGTYERWQKHVDHNVEYLSQVYKDIWLCGHSMGGLLATNAAIKYSEHIRGLFLIACPFKLRKISARVLKARFVQMFSKKIKTEYKKSSSVPHAPPLLWHTIKPYSELKKLIVATKANLPNLQKNVTAAYSTSDETTSIKSLDILKSGLTKATLEQIQLTDSMHAYFPEHERQLLTQALLKMVFEKRGEENCE